MSRTRIGAERGMREKASGEERKTKAAATLRIAHARRFALSSPAGDFRHRGAQRREGEGFAHDEIDSLRLLSGAEHEVAEAGEEDDRLLRVEFLDLGGELIAVHHGHRAIGHYEI